MAVLGLLFSGCDSTGSSVLGPISNESIVGKWYVRHLVEHGSISNHITTPKDTTLVTPIDEDTVLTGNEYYVDIKADGTLTFNSPVAMAKAAAEAANVTSGKWTLSGSTLKTVYGADTTTAEVGISGGQLTTVSHVNKTSVSAYATTIYDLTTTTTFSK